MAKSITDRIKLHGQEVIHHLDNAERAEDIGSYESMERSLESAARHAAIFSALSQLAKK